MNRTTIARRAAATLAAAGVTLLALAGLAGPAGAAPTTATVAETRAAGCNPTFSIGEGARTVRYGTGGQAGCVGHPATLIHDTTPGVPDTVDIVAVFDLGAGSFYVPAAVLCGQIDVFNDDVTAAINAPGWRDAGKLWTAAPNSNLDLPSCETPTTSTTDGPTTTTTSAPPVTTTVPPPTITTSATTPLPTSTTAPFQDLDRAVLVPAASLPVTGNNTRPLLVAGAVLLVCGGGLVARFGRRPV